MAKTALIGAVQVIGTLSTFEKKAKRMKKHNI